MNVASHIATLNNEHAKLENMLHSALIHHEDEIALASMKKRKLRIKDEILHLEKKHHIAA